jgi:hypothetical protein
MASLLQYASMCIDYMMWQSNNNTAIRQAKIISLSHSSHTQESTYTAAEQN